MTGPGPTERGSRVHSWCCENGAAARTVPGVERELDLANFNAPLRELSHILAERHSLIRRVHSLRGDAAVHLHEAGDGERIPGGPHHGADAVGLIGVIEQLPGDRLPVSPS